MNPSAAVSPSLPEFLRVAELLAQERDPKTGLLIGRKPHTAEVQHLERVRDLRLTAIWAGLCLHGSTHPPLVEASIGAIAGYQNRGGGDLHGNFRWYAEETHIHDTNAAFFILSPLVAAWLARPPQPDPLHDLLLDVFRHSLVWFRKHAAHPALFYTNKTVSDGALCLALAHILDDAEGKDAAQKFFETWCGYTESRGWGWGENMSLLYSQITLLALWMALAVGLREAAWPASLSKRLRLLEATLVSQAAFHFPGDYVPSIRNYHFRGGARRIEPLHIVLGWADAYPVDIAHADYYHWGLLFQLHILHHAGGSPPPPLPPSAARFRIERIFDGQQATTWIGETLRLGAVSEFPVMPGCYQNPGWGLGWQSMPAGFAVTTPGQSQYAFLQWHHTGADGRTVRHPVLERKGSHQQAELFTPDPFPPEVRTLSSQTGPVLLVSRLLLRLRAQPTLLTDQWRVPDFTGSCHAGETLLETASIIPPGTWVLLAYGQGLIALRALSMLPLGPSQPTEPRLHIAWETSDLLIRQVLAQDLDQPVPQSRVQSSWLVVALDGIADAGTALRELHGLRIEETWQDPKDIPRPAHEAVHTVRVDWKGTTTRLTTDPCTPRPS